MNSFIAELRRRNVFKVTAGYGVVSWLLMQLAAALEASLHLPAWFDTLVTVLVLIGFPIAVMLSWIMQFTPTGVERTLKNPDIDDATHTRHSITIYSLTSIITLGFATLMWFHLGEADFVKDSSTNKQSSASALSDDIDKTLQQAIGQSIAVLPFDDFSAANDQSYFGRGISEELLNVLSRVKGLRVVSRTSSFAFTGKDSTVTEIASALSVAHVLEGSVRKSGDMIRITAQLINAITDEHIWSDTYDRPLSAENLFALQDEIASSIVRELKGKLTIMPIPDSDKTLSLQAYELYLQARENQNLRTQESLALAIEGFTQVVDLDPKFAPGYSGLAETYLLMEAYAGLDKQVSRDKAEPLIARALELAPESVEVLTSVAYLASDKKTAASIKRAEEFASKAIAANSNYANAYFILGGVLWEQGRLVEALNNYKKARSLDPLSAVVLSNLARLYLYIDDHINAKRIGEDLVRLHPTQPFGFIVLADIALNQGEYAIAHTLLQDAYALNQENTVVKNNLRRIYNLTGLYDLSLLYQDNPTSRVWYGIYTNDLAQAAKSLPQVKEITEIGWFLYYLRDYNRTKQIVNGYINNFKLLDRPISDAGSADFILAYAQIQKATGESYSGAIEMLDDYLPEVPTDEVEDIRALKQRVLLATLKGQYQQSYQWIDRMLALDYILIFTDPIFDDIKADPEFMSRQAAMQQLRDKQKMAIEEQLAVPKSTWIVLPAS